MAGRVRRIRLIGQIGVGQTIGYASSYYLPAVLAPAISADIGLNYSAFYLLISAATLISVVLGPRVGRWIDGTQSHNALPLSTGFFAVGLCGMSLAPSAGWFIAGWCVLAIGATLGLYEVAFATVVRLEPDKPRGVIAGITLIAGFASTVGWPLTSLLADAFDWRGALLVWAALHLVVNLPAYLLLPEVTRRLKPRGAPSARRQRPTTRVAIDSQIILFGLVLAAGGFVQGAMGLHLIPVLESHNVAAQSALWAATLMGPGQVVARLLQVLLPGVFTPRRIALLSLLLHIIASAAFLLVGGGFAGAFSFIHGMGAGFYTVAIATLPLEMYGPRDYGQRQGYILGISRATTVATPFAFSFAVITLGQWSLLVTSGVSAVGIGLLAILMRRFRHRHRYRTVSDDADPVTVETGPIDIPDGQDLR